MLTLVQHKKASRNMCGIQASSRQIGDVTRTKTRLPFSRRAHVNVELFDLAIPDRDVSSFHELYPEPAIPHPTSRTFQPFLTPRNLQTLILETIGGSSLSMYSPQDRP